MNDLAIRSQQQSQHSMSTRMLRAHVDEHLVRLNVKLDNARIFYLHAHDLLTDVADRLSLLMGGLCWAAEEASPSATG
jgi:hypothetical protein